MRGVAAEGRQTRTNHYVNKTNERNESEKKTLIYQEGRKQDNRSKSSWNRSHRVSLCQLLFFPNNKIE